MMKHSLILSALIWCVLASCSDNVKHEKAASNNSGQTDTATHLITQAFSNDTLIVDKKAAVFVFPDSISIEKRKKEIGEQDFQTGADDYAFYLNSAGEFLDSVKMTIIDARDKKIIKFIGSDKNWQIINVTKLPELWSVYFFDPAKKAKVIDMTDIEQEYKSYFK